jgi:hypothetical protein
MRGSRLMKLAALLQQLRLDINRQASGSHSAAVTPIISYDSLYPDEMKCKTYMKWA